MIQFIINNKAAIALVVYAILDLLILINPKLEANGLIHQILLIVQKISGGGQPPAIPPQAPIAS